MLHAQGGAQPDFLCVWSEAYAGMQDGAAGLFLCTVGEGWRYPTEGGMFFDAASVVAAHGWKIPASFGGRRPAAYMDLSPVLEDTRSPLSFL